MRELDDDDFGDLYADVEVQVSSAINSIQASTKLQPENDEVFGNGGENAEAEEEGAQGEEDGNESESEDDFNIVLNDDKDNDNANGNANAGKVAVLRGFVGQVGNDEQCGIEEENEGDYGVENSGSTSGEKGNGGKGDCSADGYNSQYKNMRSNSAVVSSYLKSNASAAVASYSSTFVRDLCENDGCTYQFRARATGSQVGRNFALPRSRTIFDVNIDALEQKLWRNPGADITDFFNFGFDEDSWKSYCNDLDRHREQANKVTGSTGYQHATRSKDHKVGFELDVVQEATRKNIIHCNQMKAVSLTNEVSCRQPQSEMLKGRAIQVEDGLRERQASVDIRLSVERDSNVIIEIPVQDLDEDILNSTKLAFDTATGRDADIDDAGDMLCFSASEDEPPVLEGPTGSGRTSKTDPDRCSRHTSTGESDPSSSDSDSCSSPHVFNAFEQQLQVMECDTDGLAEGKNASDEPERSVEQHKLTTTETPEPSQSEQSLHSQNLSTYQSDDARSRGYAYEDLGNIHDHLKRESSSSASDLRESITLAYHSSKDSRNLSMRPGDFKNVPGSRSPVIRNVKFKKKRSIRMSGTENCLDNRSALHKRSCRMTGMEKHLDTRSAWHISDAEELYDAHHRAVGAHRGRNRHHDFDSYEDKNDLYKEKSEHHLNYGRTRYPRKAGSAFSRYRHGKDNRDCGYKQDRHPGQNVNGKEHCSERRIPRLTNEVMERKWNHYRTRVSVQEIDYSDHDALKQLTAEQSPYLDNVNNTRSKRKADELQFKRRMKNDDFSSEHDYSIDYTREYEPMPYNGRERYYLENTHDKQLPVSRREVMSPLRRRRGYGNPQHDSEGIWHSDCEEARSRWARNHLSFLSNTEPQTAGRVKGRAAPFSRNGMFERHGERRRKDYVERYRVTNKLDDYADGHIYDYDNMQRPDDHDHFLVRRQYWQSEVLHWSEEEYKSRHQEDIFEFEGASYPPGRSSRYKMFDSKPGSGSKGKLIDGWEPDERRYKQPTEGDRLDRSPNSVHRDNLWQALPSHWDSTDSHIVVGDCKSSRYFKETRSLVYYGRCDLLDWNDDLEQRSTNGFNEPHRKKAVQADRPKTGGFQDDANCHEKLPAMKQNDSLDTEEGQVVSEHLNKKPMQKANAGKFASVKKFPGRNAAADQRGKVEELETPRIMEILAKMEKRRERFQQPITPKNLSENDLELSSPDSKAQIVEGKVQRPARKRKWDGS